jgi:hypothetical protein
MESSSWQTALDGGDALERFSVEICFRAASELLDGGLARTSSMAAAPRLAAVS